MKLRFVGVVCTIFVALLILSASFLKTTSIKYAYSQLVLSETVEAKETDKEIDYFLAYQGKINPDNPLWYIKAIRDRVWQIFTFNDLKKVELNLLFSDKRLNSAIYLFKKNKPDIGLTTLLKAEKYLEKAYDKKIEDIDYHKKVATSALKHRQVIETEILPLTPEDLRPQVIKTIDYSKETYKKARDFMLSKGAIPPDNPFE
jgi:hypothetical protein